MVLDFGPGPEHASGDNTLLILSSTYKFLSEFPSVSVSIVALSLYTPVLEAWLPAQWGKSMYKGMFLDQCLKGTPVGGRGCLDLLRSLCKLVVSVTLLTTGCWEEFSLELLFWRCRSCLDEPLLADCKHDAEREERRAAAKVDVPLLLVSVSVDLSLVICSSFALSCLLASLKAACVSSSSLARLSRLFSCSTV